MTIVRKSLNDTTVSEKELKRLASMKDEDIDFSDIPEVDKTFFKNASIRLPQGKKQVTVRFDEDMLKWFRSQGKGYQSRMNAVLRAYYEAHSDNRAKDTEC